MSQLRVKLDEKIRKFLRNQLESGTRKEIIVDQQNLVLLAVVDTGEAFDKDLKNHPMSLLLSFPWKIWQGVPLTLEDDLLQVLTAFSTGSYANPKRFAREVLDEVQNIPLAQFLSDGRPVNLKKREQRLRTRLEKRRLKLRKSRVRNPRADQYGEYEVIDAKAGAPFFWHQPRLRNLDNGLRDSHAHGDLLVLPGKSRFPEAQGKQLCNLTPANIGT
jgi:hypothetical protein